MAIENKFGPPRTNFRLLPSMDMPFMKRTTPEERFEILCYGLGILGLLAIMAELYMHLPHR